jgi:hypothetical protein
MKLWQNGTKFNMRIFPGSRFHSKKQHSNWCESLGWRNLCYCTVSRWLPGVWDGEIYATVSRWLPGVPSALNKVISRDDGTFSLEAYPNWEMQTLGK